MCRDEREPLSEVVSLFLTGLILGLCIYGLIMAEIHAEKMRRKERLRTEDLTCKKPANVAMIGSSDDKTPEGETLLGLL